VKGVTSTVKVPRQFLPVFFVGLMGGLAEGFFENFLALRRINIPPVY